MKPKKHEIDGDPLVVSLSRIFAEQIIFEAKLRGVTTDKLVHDLIAEAMLARSINGALLSDDYPDG